MNTVIINGIPSTTISGLLIQKLPNVRKPEKRVSTTLIDGRSGDRTTDLGYSAYDRDMLIGLHGKYNVYDVIRYFNTSGTIVFSNEPHVVYSFKVIKAIDFEKLIRFRQATITFHVQPYKHALNEIPIEATSSPIKVNNSGNTKSCPKITIYGSGNISFYKGSSQILSINLGSEGYITIDSELLEAYKDSETNYKNRLVTGDYENLALDIGESTYSWSGTVTKVIVANYSRWV